MMTKAATTEKILDRVRKLLALSTSPNEAEAHSALVKARQIMAEHKLTEADVASGRPQSVVEIFSGITFSARRDAWILGLANLVSENMCCRAVLRVSGRTYNVGIFGFEEDAALALKAVEYAVAAVREANAQSRRELRRVGYSTRAIADRLHSYGEGFTAGLRNSYAHAEQEWGLALQIPEQVESYGDQFGKRDISTTRPLCRDEWGSGYKAGTQYKQPAGAISAQHA